MAFASQQITLVATTATPLLVQGTTGTKFLVISLDLQDPLPCIIKNESTTVTAYLGGPNVTNSNGQSLGPGQSSAFNLYGNDVPYAYSTGTPTISVMVGRQ